MYDWEGVLDFKNEECVVFYLFSGQSSASPSFCYSGMSVHRGLNPAAQSGAPLSPTQEDLQSSSR